MTTKRKPKATTGKLTGKSSLDDNWYVTFVISSDSPAGDMRMWGNIDWNAGFWMLQGPAIQSNFQYILIDYHDVDHGTCFKLFVGSRPNANHRFWLKLKSPSDYVEWFIQGPVFAEAPHYTTHALV